MDGIKNSEWYKEEIIRMVEKIEDLNILVKIFTFIHVWSK